MATTYYTDMAEKSREKLPSKGITDPSFSLVNTLTLIATIEVPTGLATGDTIEITQELQGKVALLPQLSFVIKEGGAGTLAFTVGDAEDAEKYSKAIDAGAAADDPKAIPFGTSTQLITPKVAPLNSRVLATVTSASGIPAGTILTFSLAFASVD